MHGYDAKVVGITDAPGLALVVDLGFDVRVRVDVALFDCEVIHKTNYQDVHSKVGTFITDWLSGHGKIYVETFKQSVCCRERFLAKVFSDRQKRACLNEDFFESGIVDFSRTQGWSA